MIIAISLDWSDDVSIVVCAGPCGSTAKRYADQKKHAMKQSTLSDELDVEKLAEVALGLLAPTIHDGARAWKGMDWGVMNLLFERGWIHDPRGQAKSVVLTETGLGLAEKLLLKHFAKHVPDPRG